MSYLVLWSGDEIKESYIPNELLLKYDLLGKALSEVYPYFPAQQYAKIDNCCGLTAPIVMNIGEYWRNGISRYFEVAWKL